jgi:hypothetical protein
MNFYVTKFYAAHLFIHPRALLTIQRGFASVVVIDESLYTGESAAPSVVPSVFCSAVIVGRIVDFTPDRDAYTAALDPCQRYPHPIFWVFCRCDDVAMIGVTIDSAATPARSVFFIRFNLLEYL